MRSARLGVIAAVFLIAGPWLGLLTHPEAMTALFAAGVTLVVLPFAVILVWVDRKRAHFVPDRRPARPPTWAPTEPPPHPTIGPHAWAWARFGVPEDTPHGSGGYAADVVTDARRDAAPVAAALPLTDLPALTPAEQEALLDQMPEVCAVWAPIRWPICCARVAVVWLVQPLPGELAALEQLAGPLDRCDPSAGWARELADLRSGLAPEDGVNIFVCSRCKRVYGAYAPT